MKRGRPKGLSRDTRSFGPLGDLIRKHRLAKTMGLAEVAKACKCSVQFISNIEHGRAPLPWEKAEMLAKVLDIPTSDLQSANMAVRSDFQNFLGTNGTARAVRAVKKSSTALKSLQDSASIVALTANDPQLRELIAQYTAASASDRKKLVASARRALEA